MQLNTYKNYKDKWLPLVIWMILAYVMMLLPLCWGSYQRAESETETAGTAELREPWRLIEDELWLHQEMPPIEKETEHERFKELASAYSIDASKIWTVENHYWLTEWLTLCLVISETSWWHKGYGTSSCNNLGNVWNNDRGNRVCYAFVETWLEKIWQTLTNKYLGGKQTLWCLSNAWHCNEPWDNGSRYATSDGNWERNMVSCLSTIYWRIDPSTFNIRNR